MTQEHAVEDHVQRITFGVLILWKVRESSSELILCL